MHARYTFLHCTCTCLPTLTPYVIHKVIFCYAHSLLCFRMMRRLRPTNVISSSYFSLKNNNIMTKQIMEIHVRWELHVIKHKFKHEMNTFKVAVFSFINRWLHSQVGLNWFGSCHISWILYQSHKFIFMFPPEQYRFGIYFRNPMY